ncbi:hypothetical protein [Kutzneria kofuensis]|uniref:Uncharacterized protein n=1 Tax=Kutzneria kofuensis TaxID=103725 RepID=A0A7W9NLU2_9PSEU|nr:hypothetical protein [Kutzneria kofuensis]MBB5896663.1 hypothetical protein [Kutzneria kofuensis]
MRLAVLLDEAGDADLAELTKLLRDAGAAEVERPRFGEPRDGVRSVDSEIADVVATVTPAIGLVERIVKAVRGWLGQRPRRTLKIVIGKDSIELTGYSTAAEDMLVRAFVERVCERG